jgi:hypothetical protein
MGAGSEIAETANGTNAKRKNPIELTETRPRSRIANSQLLALLYQRIQENQYRPPNK